MTGFKNIVLFFISLALISIGVGVLFYVFTPLPIADTSSLASRQSTSLVDRNGEFLFNFSLEEQRTYVPVENISENIVNATIAIEDQGFYSHSGISFLSLLRATFINVTTLSYSQGGSTITQQVVKNTFLESEKKIERKLKELLLSYKLEGQLSKDKIMEIYLNTISYGGVSYGIGNASETFFGKAPNEISISEAAYLAAIPNAPTYFSPYGQNRRALSKRKDLVLENMFKLDFISQEEYIKAKNEVVHFQPRNKFNIQAPHFVFYVKEELENTYGTSLRAIEGKTIETSIDLELQKRVEEILLHHSPSIEERFGAKNIAAVVLNSRNGEILSLVGSKDFFDESIAGSVNIITSNRQPGSTFKPIVYAEAFEKGLTPKTIIYDVPTQFSSSCEKDRYESTKETGCYSPVNYTGEFKGPITLRNALAQSINIPAVKVLYIAEVSDVIKLAQDMGITTLTEGANHYGLSLALGGAEIKPLELAQAYSVFANGGELVKTTWEKDKETARKNVLSNSSAKKITSILTDNDARAPVFGHNSALYIRTPEVAVKTGTTNNSRDIWVVGYSPEITVLVWAGNANGDLLDEEASGASLGPAFRDIITLAAEKYGESIFFDKNIVFENKNIDVLNGIVSKKDTHSLLHFIEKGDPVSQASDPESDSQYENWEYAVNDWIEEEGFDFTSTKERSLIDDFRILSPKRKINTDGPEEISVTEIPLLGTMYEFYVDGEFIGTSSNPFIVFIPNRYVNKEKVTISVVANTPEGIFRDEAVIDVD